MIVLLDTQAWALSLIESSRLPTAARQAILDATGVYVSPISVFEIAQKVRLGKWDEMTPYVRLLPEIIDQQGLTVAPLTPKICETAGSDPWPHRDPFDRFIFATAKDLRTAIISGDRVFDEVAERIWE